MRAGRVLHWARCSLLLDPAPPRPGVRRRRPQDVQTLPRLLVVQAWHLPTCSNATSSSPRCHAIAAYARARYPCSTHSGSSARRRSALPLHPAATDGGVTYGLSPASRRAIRAAWRRLPDSRCAVKARCRASMHSSRRPTHQAASARRSRSSGDSEPSWSASEKRLNASCQARCRNPSRPA